ncbi:hypothetical protein GCM10011414_04440 [Croceivirga lutea]|nr:hypothetical protein GCM10011414_04440 [Croceivirga lutea]
MTSLGYPSQESNKLNRLEGIYLGKVENSYSFCIKSTIGNDETVYFDDILSVILDRYPIHLQKHIGEHFIISYIEREIILEEKREKKVTIIRLQKVLP